MSYDAPPGYDAPPSYEPEANQTAGGSMALQNLDPSAPPAYDENVASEANAPPSRYNEGNNTAASQVIVPQIIDATQPKQSPRKIYIVKQPNEPTPIIIVITPDMVDKYSNEHIVYPKGQEPKPKRVQQREAIIKSLVVGPTANRDAVNEAMKALYHEPPPSYNTDTNNNPNLFVAKPQWNRPTKAGFGMTTSSTNYHNNEDGKTMIVYQGNGMGTCCNCSVDTVNEDKRTPLDSPKKYNLMYGRCNLLLFILMWVIFGVLQSNHNSTLLKEYCYNTYNADMPSSCYSSSTQSDACDADTVCQVERYSDDYNCYDENDDCQCCASSVLSGDAASNGIFIAFYVFLAFNTFRLIILSSIVGMNYISKAQPTLYTTNAKTNKVQLQSYMNYLADHPASYIAGLFYSEANKAMKEAIVYEVSFPSTNFLYMQLVFFYIPLTIIISCILYGELVLIDKVGTAGSAYQSYPTPRPTPNPTYYWEVGDPTPSPTSEPFVNTDYETSPVLAATCTYCVAFMLIGFIMHVCRWKKRNVAERENVKRVADEQGKEIIPPREDSNEQLSCFGYSKMEYYKRVPSETPKKWNLIYRWINFITFWYLWIVFIIGNVGYDYFFYCEDSAYDDYWYYDDLPYYGEQIAFTFFLCFNTMRLMGITLCAGLGHVDNDYNYIVDKDTGKVRLRYFMDYLCDHPVGFVIGFLYPDVSKAIKEGLIWNITFPETKFLVMNIMLFYLPMSVLCGLQSQVAEPMGLLFNIGCTLAVFGIISNGWRLKMKNDVENINANK